MPGAESREASRDRDAIGKHQHSWSESGRGSVPMWDSSDPERAPPPLPFPPGAQSPTTKANTSAGIAAAAKLIVERARENTPISSYTSTRESTPQNSPERSLIKGAHHKRMQTLQSSSCVKDLRNYIDNNRSPERSPERPASGSGYFSRKDSAEDIASPFERSSTPTPAAKDPTKETPTLRPTARIPPRPLLGENTPPSATMLALQTMQVPDALNDITNGPSTPTPTRPSTGFDFSSQLLNLTTIANNLQKEMAQLSRRSKDNAVDLTKLKDATNQRDEDIRKSLRDLSSNIHGGPGLLPPPAPGMPRSASSFPSFLDSKPWNSPPSATKSHSVPRAASVQSFLDDRVGSPSPFSVEGAASVAMLEKIIREMVTKEGQERLQDSLSEILEKNRKENSHAAKKVEELSEFIKEKSQSQALVHVSKDGPPKLDLSWDSPGGTGRTRDAGGKEAKMISTDEELMKMLQRIKDSIAHSGGTSSEVKGLVRDLRGEVLGMGRDLGKKLEKVSEAQLNTTLDRSIEDGQGKLDADEVQRIVEEGMAELKDHLSDMMKQRAEQDDHSFKQLANVRGGPDGDEMFAVVKHALAEHGSEIVKREPESVNVSVDHESVLDAVKEGLKDFEPNIELQQFGLERDEILSVLKEGLEEYTSKDRVEPAFANIDKGEVYEAMQEALKDFRSPISSEQIAEMKDEILHEVREALQEYRPAASGPSFDGELTRAAVLEAVREGIADHGPSAPREIEISRDDLFAAVKASLDGSSIPFGGFGDQVLTQLRELIDGMHVEFKQYSAANGRDTEQVLDAMKDGLESLRAEVESYVDRAQDVTGKDEIVDTVKVGLELLRADIHSYIAQGARHGSDESARGFDAAATGDATGIIMTLKEGIDELKSHVSTSRGIDDEEGKEEMLEAVREEFDQLKTAILNANAHDKSELVETIQDGMGALHAKLAGSDLSNLSGGATEEVINEMHVEFATLKETLGSIIGDADRDAIVSGVRQSIDDLRTQLSADQSDAAVEALTAIKEELSRFRENMDNSVPLRSAVIDGETSEKASTAGVTDEMLEAIREEFETVRSAIATGIIQGGASEEVLDTVHVGLDDLRSHIDKKLDNPELATQHQGEILDAINDGLETLRTDVIKTLDKPLDMTVNYEILDTLKDGLAGLRVEIDKLKGVEAAAVAVAVASGEVVLADETAVGGTRDVSSEGTKSTTSGGCGIDRTDFAKVEVLLATLQIKIEAMASTMQDSPAMDIPRSGDGAAMKDDVVALEVTLKDIQDSIASIGLNGGALPGEGVARKEDTDAIETLLRNTKAQLEDIAHPDSANAVTKDHLDSVEAVVRVTNEAIDALADKLDNSTAGKADVAVVEVLAQDVKMALEELKDKIDTVEADRPDPMTKADLDVLGVMITEIKGKVIEMSLPDPEDLPSKSDIEQLQGLITDFRESHDKMRDSYETDIQVTAKAFDDRKKEFEDTVQDINEVKNSLADIKDELLSKLGDGETSLDSLAETLQAIDEKTGDEHVTAEIKELMDKVAKEFESTHGTLELMKADSQLSSVSVLEKQVEQKDALVHEIGEKLETYFDGLMTKYDDAQHAAEEKAKTMESKSAEQGDLIDNMKTMADDLRLSIDTLGTTLTSFPDTIDKMVEESKSVFNRVDDTFNKLDETQEGLRYEHSVTRDEVTKVMAAVGGLQSDLSEHNPRFMITLKEVQALIGQHYEHSQRASDAAVEHAQAVKDLQEQIRGIGTQNEELKTNVSSLPALLPAPSSDTATTSREVYDDSGVHEKLDQLMGHAQDASSGSAQLAKLDEIHEKVMATAAEVSAFVTTQAKQITEDHESKEREAEELALLLERRQVQKDEIEADITVLNEEKDSLRTAVEELRAEQEALAAQKSRLAAEVSSLETAMHIRRDELHDMDRKAEGIERRMLEGVMNQSRMLLLAKTSKSPPKKKPQGRDLRIPSNASAASAQTVTSSIPALKANHALAMKSRPAMQRNGLVPNTSERRIMSLNQINHNVPTGGSAFSPTPSLTSNGPQSLKRSHSVKTQFMRKPSWAGKRNTSVAEQDKENGTLSEISEDEIQRPESRDMEQVGDQGDATIERRTSYMSGTESQFTRTDLDGITPGTDGRSRSSYGTSDVSYETGSYMTGSEIDQRSSIGLLGTPSALDDEPDEEFHELDGENEDDAAAGAESEGGHQVDPVADSRIKDLQMYAPPSDSGLGTDMPTAALSSIGSDYFKG